MPAGFNFQVLCAGDFDMHESILFFLNAERVRDFKLQQPV